MTTPAWVVAKVALVLTLVPHIHHHHKEEKPEPKPEPAVTPAPDPPPTPASTSTSAGVMSEGEVIAVLDDVGFPPAYIPEMVSIAQRESGLCPTAVFGHLCGGSGYAVSGGPACGLWQIYPCPGPEALNPWTNARYALAKCNVAVAAGYSCLRPWE